MKDTLAYGHTSQAHHHHHNPYAPRSTLRARRVSPSHSSSSQETVVDHPELHFYDVHLSTLHDMDHPDHKPHADDPYTHASTLQRRKSKKVQELANSKSRDLYADLIIVFKYKNSSAAKESGLKALELEQQTLQAYKEVLDKMTEVGLHYETRPRGHDTILIFVLCPWSVLKREVVRDSIHDFLTGIKVADTAEAEQLLKPAKERDHSLDNLTDSDRIRLIYELLTQEPSEGGAGICPEEDGYVQSILPLHNWGFNKSWLRSWSTKWFVNHDDLTVIRDHFGERVAYYFEFLDFYFLWLLVPTSLGVLVHFYGSSFSIFYSFSVILWAVVFIESWKRRERELALLWGVRNVRQSETRRIGFQGDRVIVDPVTDQEVPFFSPWKRCMRKIAGVPVILAGALALSTLVTMMFAVEVFLEMYYDGYMKEVLVYLPMVLFTIAMPYVEDFFNDIAKRLTDFENHETEASYDYHLVQKVFIFKVLNNYLSILLTAYVYIPFGPRVISLLQDYGLPFGSVAIEPHMLQDRLQAFMISSQVINFFTETIYPWATRKFMKSAAKIQKEVVEVLKHEKHVEEEEDECEAMAHDPEDIKQFLKVVQNQVELPVYDVNEDYGEMAEQFGYVTLFSLVWPLTSMCAFINNWIELRSDAAKICFNTRRPIPSRTDTIGPWITNLEHLTWFASLTNASILYVFRGAGNTTSDDTDLGSRLSLSILLVCLFASEHAYMGLRWGVKMVLDGIPTTAELSVRKKDYTVKKSWLSRLNDAVESTLDAVGLNKTNRTSALDGQDMGATDGDNASTKSDVTPPPFEEDLGAQAIRSMFKSK